jgi:hypothetical protein
MVSNVQRSELQSYRALRAAILNYDTFVPPPVAVREPWATRQYPGWQALRRGEPSGLGRGSSSGILPPDLDLVRENLVEMMTTTIPTPVVPPETPTRKLRAPTLLRPVR